MTIIERMKQVNGILNGKEWRVGFNAFYGHSSTDVRFKCQFSLSMKAISLVNGHYFDFVVGNRPTFTTTLPRKSTVDGVINLT